MYLINSLPARLLAQGAGSRFAIEVISKEEAVKLCSENSIYSAIGHQPAAERLTRELGFEVPMNRVSLDRMPSGGLLVANIVTPKRSPEESVGYSEAQKLEMPINWLLVRQTEPATGEEQ